MGSFRGFIVKEFHHIFRDYRTLVILFGMPVIQLILFGYAIRNEVSDIQVGFLDPVRDELTMDLKTRIDASSYFISKGDYDTLDDIERAFQDGTIREAVVFEPDFSHKLRHDGSASLSVIADGTGSLGRHDLLAVKFVAVVVVATIVPQYRNG